MPKDVTREYYDPSMAVLHLQMQRTNKYGKKLYVEIAISMDLIYQSRMEFENIKAEAYNKMRYALDKAEAKREPLYAAHYVLQGKLLNRWS
jgi:hypothetical protein